MFLLGSLGCAASDGLGQLVAGRFVQGVGGAMMVPVGRLVLLRTIDKAELVRALSWLTIPAMLGPMLGPVLGGAITTYAHWRFIFLINLPMGALGMWLAWRHIPELRQVVGPLDLRGFGLSAGGLALAMFGLSAVGRGLVPVPVVAGCVIVGVLMLLGYVQHARHHPHPLLRLDLFRIPTFRAGVLGGSLFRIGIGALPFLLPLLFQIGFGMTPLQSGLLTFGGAVGAMTMKTTVAPILRRFGIKRVLIANTVLATFFVAACALFRPTSPYLFVFLILVIGGFFRSLQFSSLNSLAFADLGTHDMSKATSFTGVAQQLSITAGVAIGALALEGARFARGETALTVNDFSIAFLVVALFSASSIFMLLPLPIDAGAALTAQPPPEAPPAESGKL